MEETIRKTFTDWILQNEYDGITISTEGEQPAKIILTADYASAEITFSEIGRFQVTEFSITDRKDNTDAFYLHFELTDLSRAKELYEEMMRTFFRLKENRNLKVMLCCTSGITTSYFADKLTEAAKTLDLNWEFGASNYDNLYQKGFGQDVILIAPQVGYLYDKVREIMKDKLVIKVPASVFGAYNVSEMIAVINRELHERHEEEERKMVPYERIDHQEQGKILIITSNGEDGGYSIRYRIYSSGAIIDSGEFLKLEYGMEDLEDIAGYSLRKHPDLKKVIITTLGIVNDGKLTYHRIKAEELDVKEHFEKKFGIPFLFVNESKAMALGFYAMQNHYRNVSFYYHVRRSGIPGCGNVIDGKIWHGYGSVSGEINRCGGILNFPIDPEKMMMTPEGALEVVARYMMLIITGTAPEAIAVNCSMITDTEELRKVLERYIEPRYIPLLVKVNDSREYAFAGALMLSAEEEN